MWPPEGHTSNIIFSAVKWALILMVLFCHMGTVLKQ